MRRSQFEVHRLPNVTGEGSKLSYDELVKRAKEFDGVIYSIWVDTQSYEPLSPLDIQQETFDLAHDRMRDLADHGGGVFYECEELKDLAGAYDRVVSDLGTVYTLSYRPTNKVRDDAVHLLVGFEHKPKTAGRWEFTRWDLVDLAHFKVRLKAEFQGSNRDIYKPDAIVSSSVK